MSRSGSGYGGGYPSKKPIPKATTKQGYSMNAVPPPSSLTITGRHHGSKSQQRNSQQLSQQNSGSSGLSKHGYSTMDAISQFATSSLYAVGSKRKTKTEDEYDYIKH